MEEKINRQKAWDVLCKYNKSDALRKHGLAVEGAMRHFAKLYNEDEDVWGIIGLLHDIDYEMYPDEHCAKSQEIMKEEGFSESYIRAVASHGYGIVNEIKPESNAEKVLYTIDELTGLIGAAALMRPSKSVMDLEVKSVKKKFKTKGFAAGVDRNVILNGCKMIDMELDKVIENTILGMRNVAEDIGL
ncbi:HDIG domain-containing metalloprotein [Clostridium beijerinckii]|uniref:Nucleotidyltransferase with HDIG domain n=1 Tax=Clostridium beijerinckii TaxID=1520 RepID=A0A9Q5CFJ8_CLOBE|nr:HDIG domain-containing metalloprotein [Clostridium beijerinckii]AQS07272.1 tRNA 2'-O-methylase [Clostridium beijerinckii]MBA2887939.1 putative nucleotidyltransferase with HDIG domain [Clostridium beijerinckii]MBA2902655.1 putative nucleotidyltransferase with HDIG domain [Clostridium beijerinckii]MBA2912498.1 putative nucleotidyltransferase with HDIG domain [Clostridium beijerinckii]MBA9013096.1 putative nucleotidyltransferase with HDIG domain [Clostridium beijerinckii]